LIVTYVLRGVIVSLPALPLAVPGLAATAMLPASKMLSDAAVRAVIGAP
jgi:hypothetical protein